MQDIVKEKDRKKHKGIKRGFPRVSILSARIAVLLGMVIFVIIGIYSVLFSKKYETYDLEIISQENMRTLLSLDTSLDTMITTADNYSKMLIADGTIQMAMRQGNLLRDTGTQSIVIKKLYSIFQFSNYVDAIWLIDQDGQRLTVGGKEYTGTDGGLEDLQFLRKPYGSYQMMLFSEGREKEISLVRSYNDTDDFKSLGIVGVDISYKKICELFDHATGTEGEIVIFDENGGFFYRSGDEVPEKIIYADHKTEEGQTVSHVINGQKYLVTQLKNGTNGWSMIRYMPIPGVFTNNEMARFAIRSTIILGITILVCALLLSGLLTIPIQQLLSCMKEMKKNNLVKIEEKPILPEFKILFQGYNKMVDRISALLAATVEKQKRIRQIELNEIQEQMKPHFLYNTLDSIQALALMGESEKVCMLVENLGDFYRKSVSGGREFIRVAEEIRIVQDYIDIMKVRFEGRFSAEIVCQEEAKDYLIPKLILQPLVENSFQYGVRGTNRYGNVCVQVTCDDSRLHLYVWDDGPGMSEEILKELADGMGTRKSLGLRGTVERLRLYYGESFTYEISIEDGTGIHLYLSLKELKTQAQEE